MFVVTFRQNNRILSMARHTRLCVRAQVRLSIWNSRSFCRLCVFPICRYRSHLSISLITQQYSCECTLWFRQYFDACNFSHRRIFFGQPPPPVVFPSSKPREINAKREKILGRRASLGLQLFAALPFGCPRPTVTQKKGKRQLTVWHKIKIFSLIFLLEDKCNLKSNKSCEDCVQDGVR